MINILIGGYYGAGNIGDEAILECMLNDIRSESDNFQFTVTSFNPAATARCYHVRAIHWKDPTQLIKTAKASDVILLGGGGLFQDYWGLDPATYLRKKSHDITAYGSLPLLAKLLGIPCMLYAIGLGPITSDIAREHTRFALENSTVITLRDEQSLRVLYESGFNPDRNDLPVPQVLADPAFTLTSKAEEYNLADEIINTFRQSKDSQFLGISLRYWDFSSSQRDWLANLSEGIKVFLEKYPHYHAVLIPFQNNPGSPYTNDLAFLKSFHKKLNHKRLHIIKRDLTPGLMQAVIRRMDLLLGMRLHSLIFGINTSTPIAAIPYDPKIKELMYKAELNKYCFDSMIFKPNQVFETLELIIKEKKEIQIKLATFLQNSKDSAKTTAEIAKKLIQNAGRQPPDPLHVFSLNQAVLINSLDKEVIKVKKQLEISTDQLHQMENDNQTLKIQLNNQKQSFEETLNTIYQSKSWKFISHYYQLINSPIMRVLTHTLGIRSTRNSEQEKIKNVIAILNTRRLKGIFIITSTFPFEKDLNQRAINIAKYLSKAGWGIIFIGWRWNKRQKLQDIEKEIFRNIFQIPIDLFIETIDEFGVIQRDKKFLLIEFPHPDFLFASFKLIEKGYKVIYDIIDDWEMFHQAGQAPWYSQPAEQAMTFNAHFVFAVSKPLFDKFSSIRKDIKIIPNGYDPNLVGRKNRYIAAKKKPTEEIIIGYFGHLSESWFDWNFLSQVIEKGNQNHIKIVFQLIGPHFPDINKYLSPHKENITYFGSIKPSNLFRYVKTWDFGIIPFKEGNLSEAVDPIKFYEYLYFGLPVIIKGIHHLPGLPNTILIHDSNDLMRHISGKGKSNFDATIKSKNIPDEAIHRFLLETTWLKRVSNLLEETNREWISL